MKASGANWHIANAEIKLSRNPTEDMKMQISFDIQALRISNGDAPRRTFC